MTAIETDLSQLQQDVGEWAEENFGSEQPPTFCVIGAGEELGELSRSVLKRAQGIDDSAKYAERDDVGPEAEKDAVGDIVIYLADMAYRTGRIDIGDAVERDPDWRSPPPDSVVDMIRMLYRDLGELAGKRLYPLDDEHMRENEAKYDWADGPPDEMEMVELWTGRVIVDLVRFCEVRSSEHSEEGERPSPEDEGIRGYDFDDCIQMAASDVLDREWDATIDVEA